MDRPCRPAHLVPAQRRPPPSTAQPKSPGPLPSFSHVASDFPLRELLNRAEFRYRETYCQASLSLCDCPMFDRDQKRGPGVKSWGLGVRRSVRLLTSLACARCASFCRYSVTLDSVACSPALCPPSTACRHSLRAFP